MNRPRLVFLVGLPGSGKSYLAETKYAPAGFMVLDDPKSKQDVIDALDSHVNLVICDPHLCKKKNRDIALELVTANHNHIVEFVFFENHPAKCMNNIRHRNDNRNIESLKLFNYEIPKWIKPLKIWQNEIADTKID